MKYFIADLLELTGIGAFITALILFWLVCEGKTMQTDFDQLTDLQKRAVLASCAIFVSKGKNKGMLLKKPPFDSDAYAAWQGAMAVCNPYKVSIGIHAFNADQNYIYEAVKTAFTQRNSFVLLDRDRKALEAWGAW
jgi:hypothetical protein